MSFQTALFSQEEDTVGFEFTTIYIPNAIIGDSVWSPCGINPEICEYLDYDLTIFNRWGEIMFHSIDPEEGWSPLEEGIADGVYVWLLRGIRLEDLNQDGVIEEKPVEIRAHFTVLK